MDDLLIICRFIHFAAAMLLFGTGIFQSVLAPPDLASLLARPLRRIVAWAAPIIAITALLWLSLETGEMGEGWTDAANPETLLTVLFDTGFGQAWQWHLGFAALLVGFVAVGRDDSWLLIAILTGLLLGSLGLVGHARIMTGTIGWLHPANHAVHLLAVGFWLGSLVPLVLCLKLMKDRLSAEAAITVHRFSILGHIAVALVIATGILNTWLILGKWPTDLSSPYRVFLLIKVSLVGGMIVIALFNRYVLLPQSRHKPEEALRMLRHTTIGETAVGLGVLAVVSVLGTLEPL